MDWLGSVPPPAVKGPIERLVDREASGRAERDLGFVYVAANSDWRTPLGRLPLVHRRAVVAFFFDASFLAPAVDWSIGGAVVLPPSTSRIRAAVTAASEAARRPGWTADPAVVREVATLDGSLRATLVPAALWRNLLGSRGVLDLLAEVATALDRPCLITGSGDLLLHGVGAATIEQAWNDVPVRPPWSVPGDLVIRAVGDDAPLSDLTRERPWLPVRHWPSGRVVGNWRATTTGDGWEFDTGDGDETVESLRLGGPVDRGEAAVLRLTGVPPSELECAGSPGAVAAEALAREATRTNRCLWIPGVTRRAATVIHRWKLPVWVDGPVVG